MTGNCEFCSNFASAKECKNAGLPTAGAADCLTRCFLFNQGINVYTLTFTYTPKALLRVFLFPNCHISESYPRFSGLHIGKGLLPQRKWQIPKLWRNAGEQFER